VATLRPGFGIDVLPDLISLTGKKGSDLTFKGIGLLKRSLDLGNRTIEQRHG
jgi:hypothetical protein